MTYSQVDSSNPKEGDLNGQLFAGDHGPEGAWASLKGKDLTPPELSFSDQDGNIGPDRLNQISSPSTWLQHGPVMSGAYDPNALTRGTDKHMPK
jgi:hypothetical protein